MKIHPIAEIFPRMSDEEFAALKEDIDTHGLREPVWTWKGQIIDGRHRFQACQELGVKKCATREFEGEQSGLVAFVLSLNLKRRHLNESQRAMVAARLATLVSEEKSSPPIGGAVPISDAADMMNVGQRSVERARKVQEQGAAALVEAVEKGEVSVGAAAEVASLPKAEQKKLVKEGAVAEKAAEIRQAKSPKPEKLDEVAKLKSEIEDLNRQLVELANQQQPLQDEVEFLRKIETEGDKLAAACAEVKKLQALVRVQEERIRGLTRSHGEAVRAAKAAQAQVAKLEKELARMMG